MLMWCRILIRLHDNSRYRRRDQVRSMCCLARLGSSMISAGLPRRGLSQFHRRVLGEHSSWAGCVLIPFFYRSN